MDRGIAKLLGDLCEVQMACPYHFLCRINLQQSKVFDDAHAAPLLENLLKLGPSHQIIPADLFDGDGGGNPKSQVVGHPAEDLGVAFALGGLGDLSLRDLLLKRERVGIPPDQMDQEMFQIETDQLLCAEHIRSLPGHILEVGIVQPAVEAAPRFDDDAGQDVALRLVDLQRLPAEEGHSLVFAVEGDYDQVRGDLPRCLYAVEFIRLVKCDVAPFQRRSLTACGHIHFSLIHAQKFPEIMCFPLEREIAHILKIMYTVNLIYRDRFSQNYSIVSHTVTPLKMFPIDILLHCRRIEKRVNADCANEE